MCYMHNTSSSLKIFRSWFIYRIKKERKSTIFRRYFLFKQGQTVHRTKGIENQTYRKYIDIQIYIQKNRQTWKWYEICILMQKIFFRFTKWVNKFVSDILTDGQTTKPWANIYQMTKNSGYNLFSYYNCFP